MPEIDQDLAAGLAPSSLSAKPGAMPQAATIQGDAKPSYDEQLAAGLAPSRSRQPGSFDAADRFVADIEGGYVANDAGAGETNFGINKRANPDVDVKNLTAEGARDIRKARYWNAIGGDELAKRNGKLAAVAYDAAINQGVTTAQQLLKASGGNADRMIELRADKYRDLIASNPEKYGKYADSWRSRLEGLKAMGQSAGGQDFGVGRDTTGSQFANVPVKPEPGLLDTAKQGFERGLDQSKALLGGFAALVSKSINDGEETEFQRRAMDYYNENMAEAQKHTSDSASFTDVLDGKGSLSRWAADSAGYLGYQITEMLFSGGLGGLIGKSVGKGVVQNVASGMVEKEIGKIIATDAGKEMARDQVAKIAAANVARNLAAGTAVFAQNVRQEGGSIYGDALEQSAKTGEPVSLAKIWLGTLAAAGVDTAADVAMARGVLGMREGSSAPGYFGRVAREVPKGAATQGGTEYAQTGLEYWGANKDFWTPEGQKEGIDSAAVGAFGGIGGGLGSAVHRADHAPIPEPAPAAATNPLQHVVDKAAEPNSPLSKAAMAGNPGVLSGQPTQAGQDSTQSGQDPISARVAAVVNELETTDTLQKLREIGPSMGAENLTNDFLYALQVARNPNSRPDQREAAIAQVEQALQWTKTGFTPATPEQPGTALAVRPSNAVGPVGQAQFFDPNTIDGEAVRVDNMLPGPKALPGPQRGLTTQEQNTPASEPVATPTKQQNVAPVSSNVSPESTTVPVGKTAAQAGVGGMAEVQAPRVETPAGTGPAVLRKRKAVVEQLVANGFKAVERNGNDHWLINFKTGQKFKLDGPADAQMARKAIKDIGDKAAHEAPSSPLNDKVETKANIDANNRLKPVYDLHGIKVRVENPQGAVREGVSPEGKAWRTEMKHHYGEVEGTEGADGDPIDMFIGDRPESTKIFVIDQINPDGSFDEHKAVGGVTSEDQARATYLANYEKGWTGLGAITEMTIPEFKAWSKSREAKKPLALGKVSPQVTPQVTPQAESNPLESAAAAGQEQFTEAEKAEDTKPAFTYVTGDKGRHQLRIIKPGELQKKTSGERKGKYRELTQGEATTLERVAALLNRRVVFFEPTDEFQTDGFVRSGDPSTIYIRKFTSINPLAVFGHEFFHTLRETNPQAWEAIAAVVASKVTKGGAKLFREDRYGESIATQRAGTELSKDNGGELEELISDLGGNLLKDAKFWKEVFDKIAKDNGAEAKGIIAKLSTAIQGAITRMVKALNQRGFRADAFVKDLDEVRVAFSDALATHLKDTDLAGRATQASAQVKKTEERPEGLTVEGYHFSKAPRQVLNSAMFGTGLKGSARDEIKQSSDPRLKQRISFYVNKGTGINPEAGVGGVAHKATLTNVYDADADPLRLKSGNARDFESKVLDNGYSGYLTRMEGSQSGQVIMLGKQIIKPEVLGTGKVEGAKVVPAPVQREQDLADRISSNEALPAGMLSPQKWSEALMAADPELAAQLLEIGAFDGTQGMYKDELAAKVRGLSGEIKKSVERAQSEYDDVVAKYKDTDQWLKAPNGNASNLSERQWVQVRTPSFKKWFGDWEDAYKKGGVFSVEPGSVSVVVDKNGEPLVVYHGTDKGGFVEFEQAGGSGRGDLGIWTTDDRGMAQSYVHKGRAKDVVLPEDPKTREDLEALGYEFFDGVDEESEYTDTDGNLYGGFASVDDAVKDALDNFEMPDRAGETPGVYALFANIRNPNESDFEGANWDGMRYGKYQVRAENGDLIDSDSGSYYFDMFDDANQVALENPGSEVQPADPHYETTDEVASEGHKYGNDGSVIRNVTDNGGGYDVYYDELPHDIFVAFDPAQIKSADYNNGEFSDSADIRKSTARKEISESVDEVTNVDAAFKFAQSRVFATNRDFKLELQQRALDAAKAARVTLDERDARTEDYLVRVGERDARSGLRDNANAVGWYNEKVSKALAILGLIHPELKTNPEARFAFTWALAVTSNGQKVGKNFELAEMVYQIYKDTGRMPTDIKAGQTQGPINDALGLFNDLRKQWGMQGLMDFMVNKDTVKSIQASSGVAISGEGMNTEVYGAAILGPKIGNGFFMNLYGQFDQLTMDRWLMRTWGRWTGTLVENDRKNIKISRERLTGLIKLLDGPQRKEFEQVIGARLSVSKIDEVAKTIQKASAKPKLRERMNEIGKLSPELLAALDEILGEAKKNAKRDSLGGELRKLGNNLAKYLDGQKEAPAGSKERDFIRKVFGRVLANLRGEMPDMTMADLQAVLWYPEKRLYDAAKADEENAESGYADDEAPDYANAAADLASQKGVPADKIAQVTKEIDDEIEANKRARNAGRGDSESLEAGQAAGAQAARGTETRGLPESVGIRGSAERLDLEGGQDQGSGRREKDGSLNGLPRDFTVDSKKITASHWAPAEDVARQYMDEAGLPYSPPTKYVKVDPERATRIAAEYDKLKHDPQNPEVKAAYAALVDEVTAQYKAVIDTGLNVEFIDFAKQGDPYAASPRLATEDVRMNNHFWVFSTRDGYGTAEFDVNDNPMLAETEFEISGQKALVNDLFRVVHDYFGHVKEGVGFRADGEENAWRAHSAMFSPLAQRALTTETRGQNSWVNYGPYAESNRLANAGDTRYADQKVGLLPLWVSEEGKTDEPSYNQRISALQELIACLK